MIKVSQPAEIHSCQFCGKPITILQTRQMCVDCSEYFNSTTTKQKTMNTDSTTPVSPDNAIRDFITKRFPHVGHGSGYNSEAEGAIIGMQEVITNPSKYFPTAPPVEQGEINEGDYCICLFGNSGHKFYPDLLQILKVKIVQKLTNTPNLLKFENAYPDQTFHANDFVKVKYGAFLTRICSHLSSQQATAPVDETDWKGEAMIWKSRAESLQLKWEMEKGIIPAAPVQGWVSKTDFYAAIKEYEKEDPVFVPPLLKNYMLGFFQWFLKRQNPTPPPPHHQVK